MAFDFILRTTLKHAVPYKGGKKNSRAYKVRVSIQNELVTFSFLKLTSYRESQEQMKVRYVIIEIHLSLKE